MTDSNPKVALEFDGDEFLDDLWFLNDDEVQAVLAVKFVMNLVRNDADFVAGIRKGVCSMLERLRLHAELNEFWVEAEPAHDRGDEARA